MRRTSDPHRAGGSGGPVWEPRPPPLNGSATLPGAVGSGLPSRSHLRPLRPHSVRDGCGRGSRRGHWGPRLPREARPPPPSLPGAFASHSCCSQVPQKGRLETTQNRCLAVWPEDQNQGASSAVLRGLRGDPSPTCPRSRGLPGLLGARPHPPVSTSVSTRPPSLLSPVKMRVVGWRTRPKPGLVSL